MSSLACSQSHYSEKGFVVEKNLISKIQVGSLTEIGEKLWVQRNVNDERRSRDIYVDEFRFHSLHLGNSFIRDLALSEPVINNVEMLLGGNAALVQAALLYKSKGCVGHHAHQDAFYVTDEAEKCLTVWIAVDDSTADNGGVEVVPGSQFQRVVDPVRLMERKDELAKTSLSLEVKSGDAVIWHGALVHWSLDMPKDRHQRRLALILNYVRDDVCEIADHLIPAIDKQGFEITTIKGRK